MGTTSTAFKGGDPQEEKLVKQLNDFLEGRAPEQLNENNRKGLEQAFRAAIDKAIFGNDPDSADANTKANVRTAVQNQIKNTMLREYETWKNAGSDMNRWPFPKKPPRNP
jgi:hypothetical protein